MKRMKTSKRIKQYVNENWNEMVHTTLDPEGPGVVRIHLIPPAIVDEEYEVPSIAIINGQDIIPVNLSWAILLTELIKQINQYLGSEVKDGEIDALINRAIAEVRKVYPFIPKRILVRDAHNMMYTIIQIAHGEIPDMDIGTMSIGDYAPYMRAPHRMDLMVSAMTKEGVWHCNQKCVHCYAAGQTLSGEKELSTDDWKKIIDKCRANYIPQLTFTGGEPTMREDLVELIEYAQWFVTRLNTNGIKLTDEFCKKLRSASLDSMQITFYSSEEEIHNKLVGAEQYSNTVQGIRNALNNDFSVSINTPLCTLNRDYVKTLEFLNNMGVRYVTCSGLITTGSALSEESESLQLTNDEIKEILEAAVAYCYEHEMEISFTSPGWVDDEFCKKLKITTPSCGACLSNMAVTPGGHVVPCQSWLNDDQLGDMLADTWEDIWNSAKCKEHRDYSADELGLCPLRRQREN